ncbi:MerR family transcriptional regulator [Lentilactobacillus parafarraginis]|uniref:MerR family transcriptional regulator n=1 Tax=Lentilactobacillus parafarraginis TaxID=390842 RepID=A0A5R9CRJ7_9LACO|nr:MerR family transcriptional regulator [Lentilactobacillus parafarraginis]TLQ17957.1 MerR family transcriptional regulator [Lentilactobacillus parafarraginis]
MGYEIGTFSKLVNISIDTLRYYEKQELIIPKRNSNNRRLYSDQDIHWIDFIKRLKRTGMPIRDIKRYAKLRYQGNSTIDDRLTLLNEQMTRLKVDKNEIQSHIDFLNQKIDTYHQLKAQIKTSKNA